MRTFEIRNVVLSYLSDAQEMVNFNKEESNKYINFAKYLIMTYDDLSVRVTEDELTETWNKLFN